MKYLDGSIVKVGDLIQLWSGENGQVVLSVDTNEESVNYQLKDWKNLTEGVLIETSRGVVVAFHGDAGEEFRKQEI